MKICLGGTFDLIHKGHEALLKKAFDLEGEVLIGLTSDKMASQKKGSVSSFESRKKKLEDFLEKKRLRNYKIVKIEDEFGPAVNEDIDVIVVSTETKATALKINEARKERGLKPLSIHVAKTVLAEDCCPISSSRIKRGEIDEEGMMLRPIVVNVGSSNKVKIKATKDVFSRLFKKVEVHGIEVDSGADVQPFGKNTIKGAVNRAKEALGKGDFGVGIEAGLFWVENIERYFDVQYCAIVDKMGKVTIGHGPGFCYPPQTIEMVRRGATIGEAMKKISGIEDIGKKMGAIGYLSIGKMNRTQLTRIAVFMALIPRIRRDLYF